MATRVVASPYNPDMDDDKTDAPIRLLQELIRYDTTNPPGNERRLVEHVERICRDAGMETELLAKDAERPNLIARLPGSGTAPPLLLYGHADVVTAHGQPWSRPAFSGEIADGCVWGRGAIDMKGGLAMMIAAILRLRQRGIEPAGDVLLAVVSDEEAGGTYGARFLVEQHAARFSGVRYALGEFGGFPLTVAGRTFYLVQVAEKASLGLTVRLTGPAGHGAFPMRNGAMARAGRLLARLDRRALPVHITPVVHRMIQTMTEALPFLPRVVLRQLLHPRRASWILKVLGSTGRTFEPLLRNTVNATLIHGGEKQNVIPSRIDIGLDARLLPGFGPDNVIAELANVVGHDVTVEASPHNPGPSGVDLGLFDALADALRRERPEALVVPFLLPATTDARFFSRIGIQSYGFTPMNSVPGGSFFDIVHGANERIAVDALAFGTTVLTTLLTRYGR